MAGLKPEVYPGDVVFVLRRVADQEIPEFNLGVVMSPGHLDIWDDDASARVISCFMEDGSMIDASEWELAIRLGSPK